VFGFARRGSKRRSIEQYQVDQRIQRCLLGSYLVQLWQAPCPACHASGWLASATASVEALLCLRFGLW